MLISLTFDLRCTFTTQTTIDLITSEQLFGGVAVCTSILTERLTHRPSNLHSAWPQMTGWFLQIVSKRLCGSAGASFYVLTKTSKCIEKAIGLHLRIKARDLTLQTL